MGTGFYINGQKYISSKDAYIASGYSEDKLLRLCFEKKIKSQGFKGGYFIEAQSLLKYVKTKHLPLSVGTLHNLNSWYDIMLQKFSELIVIAIFFLFILITPIFFLQIESFSNYDITQMSSSYNSISYFLNESDPKTVIITVNNTVAAVIESATNIFCDGVIITFNKVQEIILDMNL